MKVLLGATVLAAMVYLFPLLAQAAPPFQGQPVFDAKCKSCHTIGGGKLAGPDLKGVTEKRERAWLVEFIVSPDQVIKRGDPIATELVKQYNMAMPAMGVSQKDAEAILDYIAQQSGGTQAQAKPASAPAAAPASAGDAVLGRELFTGQTAFKNGGGPCISCHDANGAGTLGGGNLARDLTQSYANLGEPGVGAILSAAPFVPMQKAYGDNHPLTAEEKSDLTAFLREASSGQAQAQPMSGLLFPLIAVIGFLALLGVITIIWNGRLRGVRQPLIKGGPR